MGAVRARRPLFTATNVRPPKRHAIEKKMSSPSISGGVVRRLNEPQEAR
jgi:hypothetical protein